MKYTKGTEIYRSTLKYTEVAYNVLKHLGIYVSTLKYCEVFWNVLKSMNNTYYCS